MEFSQFSCSFNCSNFAHIGSTFIFDAPAVPAGKRLVIQWVSADIPSNNEFNSISLQTSPVLSNQNVKWQYHGPFISSWPVATSHGMSSASFTTYGPGQSLPAAHAPVIPRYLLQVLSGASLVVHGDGTQTRDYVYVDDVVDALVAAATARDVNRRVINVGSGHETSVQDLIAEIQKVLRRQVTPIYNHHESAGVSRMCADLSLAARVLGFHPRVSLAAGLRQMVERDKRFRAPVKPR